MKGSPTAPPAADLVAEPPSPPPASAAGAGAAVGGASAARPLVASLLGRDRLAAVGLGLALVALFVTASVLARCHHARQERFAREWSTRGLELMESGQAPQAVEAFENALVYGQGDAAVRLRLAQALVASGRDEKAGTYLQSLWQRQPGDGVVNLELARMAVRQGRLDEAVRHYQHAASGSWDVRDPVAARRRVRFELAEMLVTQGQTEAAEAELIRLSADLPRDAESVVRLGRLFLRADNPRRAREAFRAALLVRPRHAAALSGAGEADLLLGYPSNALRSLEAALRERADEGDAQRVQVARRMIALDPFRPRLSRAERGRRAAAAWEATLARLASCSGADAAATAAGGAPDGAAAVRQALEALRPRMKPGLLARDPDLVEEAMDHVFAAQSWAQAGCGPPRVVDQALQLIGRARAAVVG